jgi:hypothetical protein
MRLNGKQHDMVNAAAARVPAEKRGIFLLRVNAHLNNAGYGQVSNDDVDWAIRKALAGLIQEPVAVKGEQFAFLR